jgi:hypothetical protein
MMSSSSNKHHVLYARQAAILRKNLQEWDMVLRSHQRHQDYPALVGRMNAAFNQTKNLSASVDDILEHFVYLPRKATANPQDTPFFLSTRLDSTPSGANTNDEDDEELFIRQDAVQQLSTFEDQAAQLAEHIEQNMPRF